MTDRTVRHILHQAEILHRSHLYVIRRPAVPVADGKEGAQYQAVVHVKMNIIKTRIQRQIHGPDILFRLKKRIADAPDVNLHINGVFKAQPEIRHALRPVHQPFLA